MISVIIPVYNRPRLLLEAVASVRAQSCRNWRLVVVDDGSDEAVELPPALRDDRITVLRIAHNGMPGAVRNTGAQAAPGEYLAFLDSDDLWHPDKLAKQLAWFRENPHGVVCHTREIWDRSGRIISQRKQKHRRFGDVFRDALEKCIIGPSTVMMRRTVFDEIGGFREDLEIAEDYELWLRLTARYSVGYLEEALITKRAGHGAQLSEKYGQIEKFRIDALRKLVDTRYFAPFGAEKQRLASERLAFKCGIYAKGCFKREKREEGQRFETLAAHYAVR